MTERSFRVQVLDDDPGASSLLVIQCRGCQAEETMNDEAGGCDLADLSAWASTHRCGAPAGIEVWLAARDNSGTVPVTCTPTVRPSGHDPGCDQASKAAEQEGTRA